jgi:hypothetical protein
MKKQILILILGLLVFGCKNEDLKIDSDDRVEGLALYWDHEVFGEGGRRLRFEFYETREFENSFELVFYYKIEGKEIIITLVDKLNNGKCQRFPTPNGIDSLCTPKGRIFIPDNLLGDDNYSIILKTYDFEIKSNLIVDDEKFMLEIPSNEKFSSSITTVYPIPENLLFGGVVFSGIENTQKANDFFEELEAIGFEKTSVPNFPYRHLRVGDNGKPIDEHWEPDKHSLSLLHKMENNFEKAFELAKVHFNKTNLNIYLYSSNGDQARLSKNEGIIVEYGKR